MSGDLTFPHVLFDLAEIAEELGLPPCQPKDPEALASQLHYEIDIRIRQQANKILALMDMHDRIARLLSSPTGDNQ